MQEISTNPSPKHDGTVGRCVNASNAHACLRKSSIGWEKPEPILVLHLLCWQVQSIGSVGLERRRFQHWILRQYHVDTVLYRMYMYNIPCDIISIMRVSLALDDSLRFFPRSRHEIDTFFKGLIVTTMWKFHRIMLPYCHHTGIMIISWKFDCGPYLVSGIIFLSQSHVFVIFFTSFCSHSGVAPLWLTWATGLPALPSCPPSYSHILHSVTHLTSARNNNPLLIIWGLHPITYHMKVIIYVTITQSVILRAWL